MGQVTLNFLVFFADFLDSESHKSGSIHIQGVIHFFLHFFNIHSSVQDCPVCNKIVFHNAVDLDLLFCDVINNVKPNSLFK